MKKAINLKTEDEEIIEFLQILLDEDAEVALAFLKNHFS
jgi:hypothetical protein